LHQISKKRQMKKYLILLMIPAFLACGREAKQKAEELQTKNDSLLTQTMQKDEAINEFIRSINDIQGTLDTIKQKENIINLTTDRGGELKLSAKDQIKSDIQTIYSLMQKNKETINALSKKLKSSNLKVSELNKMVERLNKELAEKSAQIEDLRNKLAKLNASFELANLKIDTLSRTVKDQGAQINNQTQTIAVQDEALNTAYYVIGTNKELKKSGIIKSSEILSDFNKELFTKIDVRKVTEISILSKKAKILSNHPSSSYKFVGDKKVIQSLQILDYKAFWSNSKYLVIVVD
jgi:chromosome segregation ATPase